MASQQLYLLELFIDKVTVFLTEDEPETSQNKNLIIKIKFGPKTELIVKEGQLAKSGTRNDVVERNAQGRRQWSRTIRIGKSYLFPSYPDTILGTLSKLPLEIQVWNDDENEEPIYVGIGTMAWDSEFFLYLKENAEVTKLHEPISIKSLTQLYAECCCRICGEITFFLRLTALGANIITEFQQLADDPKYFVFRTNKAPSMFECNRVEGDDPNFCMIGSLYETATLEDPDVVAAANKKIEICTELESCGYIGAPGDPSCKNIGENVPKEYPIEMIKMGDIKGPCGNNFCPLAHKVRVFIRNLDAYKKQAEGKTFSERKDDDTKRTCGKCVCHDDRWHRETCPEITGEAEKALCGGCGGRPHPGETCQNTKQVNYMLGITRDSNSIFRRDYIVNPCKVKYKRQLQKVENTGTKVQQKDSPMCIGEVATGKVKSETKTMCMHNVQQVYNAEVSTSKGKHDCLEIPDDKECKCKPPEPTPPCRTLDCDCMVHAVNIDSNKGHKPYCPLYKHKLSCPVTKMMEEDTENKHKNDDDDDEDVEPLPYGLPPIQLGPCPVLGRPCTVPDGFARMYKTAALPKLPPSYSEAGKVCCSKEFERIKRAIREYQAKKKSDYRCVNKFYVDTEKSCCDKENKMLGLSGKSCCAAHKMDIRVKYEDDIKKS